MPPYLGESLKTLSMLSPMIQPRKSGQPISPTWVQVYRELVEWAILFSILDKDFKTIDGSKLLCLIEMNWVDE